MQSSWDVIVIGGGPGGYAAAIRCGQRGLKTLLIEKEQLGGTCLNVGCIPTKLLARFAHLVENIQAATAFGIRATFEGVDLNGYQKNKRTVVSRLQQGIAFLLKKWQVHVETGEAAFLSPHRLCVQAGGETRTVEAKHVIIAVGSKPKPLSILPYDGRQVLTSTDVLAWTSLPKRLGVIGAGVIGLEFASALAPLGVEVHVIEAEPNILPLEDPEVTRLLQNALTKKGVRFYTGSTVVEAQRRDESIVLKLQTGEQTTTIAVDSVLVAVGREGNTGSLNLEKAGLQTQNGYIPVNEYMQTAVPHIYAVGDVVPGPQLAHVAYEEGLAAAETIAGNPTPVRYEVVPRCIYTSPELCAVGMTEAQARQRYDNVQVYKMPWSANGMALIHGDGRAEGLVKIVTEGKYGEILGISMVGQGVNELIAEGALAIGLEATIESLADVVHPHPSLAESFKELAMLAVGKPLHVV